ncbi:hypothetical protein HYPSUDRAFT_207145 [Hypholoma sublateritium FD-334 SS-4]|uniref:F-box domain-containing protein n=1 Tax=Hypholoma sublateritium (strain FD-334 SS-4) TaxID=945553 RepID=A0A0D2LZL0_HYPSF|nr:hypothetical protein HYPSUDRAFT_207145 [Hypholoma sublateritium FD-334 SS-4]
MDPTSLPNSSVLEALLKTNRPPTDQEKAIIQESMSPTNAKLKSVESQISDAVVHIQALKSQLEGMEIKLQRLREEEAAILETFADHRRVFSSFRNIPGDILRELCVACVENDMPTLSYPYRPLPYTLAQICSEMRHIALTTPFIWSSINIEISAPRFIDQPGSLVPYSKLARRAREWLQRAGDLALDISVMEAFHESESSHVLFDCLLSYSSRWKTIRLNCRNTKYTPLSRIAALTSTHVPLLQSIFLQFGSFHCDTSVFRNSIFFTIPTLKHLTLDVDWKNVADFNINWEILTTLTLTVIDRESSAYHHAPSPKIARILRQTKCLVFCEISVDRALGDYPSEIYLPLLEVLSIEETIISNITPTGIHNLLDRLNAPILNTLEIKSLFPQLSLSAFLGRTSSIRKLVLPWVNRESLMEIADLLHHCPLLSALSLGPSSSEWDRQPELSDANDFLRRFVQAGDDGVICPRLEHFRIFGNIDLSLQTLRQFIEVKQGANAARSALHPWKDVAINLTRIPDAKIYEQMLDFISQKLAEGLDVKAFKKYKNNL